MAIQKFLIGTNVRLVTPDKWLGDGPLLVNQCNNTGHGFTYHVDNTKGEKRWVHEEDLAPE